MLTKFGVNYLFLLGGVWFYLQLDIPQKLNKTKKIAGFLLVVAHECKWESCPAWLETIYVPSLVSVAKTNPPPFLTKGGAIERLFHARLWAFSSV